MRAVRELYLAGKSLAAIMTQTHDEAFLYKEGSERISCFLYGLPINNNTQNNSRTNQGCPVI